MASQEFAEYSGRDVFSKMMYGLRIALSTTNRGLMRLYM